MSKTSCNKSEHKFFRLICIYLYVSFNPLLFLSPSPLHSPPFLHLSPFFSLFENKISWQFYLFLPFLQQLFIQFIKIKQAASVEHINPQIERSNPKIKCSKPQIECSKPRIEPSKPRIERSIPKQNVAIPE